MLAGLVLSLIVLADRCDNDIATIGGWRGFTEALILTLDNISQGILMVDQRRRMPVVNRRVAELLGLPVELARPGRRLRRASAMADPKAG